MWFGTAVVTCLRKSFRARGRASPAEFWYFGLFCVLLVVGAGAVGWALGGEDGASVGVVVYLLLLTPWTSAGIRRMHDTGRSGGWCLLLLTIVFFYPLVVWTEPSQRHDNRFGPPPGHVMMRV